MTRTHNFDPPRWLASATLLLGLLALLLPRPAAAGGYGSARFGGAHGTVVDTNPSAVYYNPGAIGFDGGHALMGDVTLALRQASYDRAPDSIGDDTRMALQDAGQLDAGIAALAGESRLTNVLAAPFFGATSDLGLQGLRVGAAFFVPFGGQSAWNSGTANADFPGAEDGSARWYNIEGVIRSLAASAAVAYRLPQPRLSLGVSLTGYFSEVDTLRARNADGSDNLILPTGQLSEGRSLLQVDGTHVGVGVGVLWEALAERLFIGASYQSQPGFGRMMLRGKLENTFATAAPSPAADVRFTQTLPDIFRLGARYRVAGDVELRLVGDYTRWSKLSQMCLALAGVDDLDAACATGADGALQNPEYGGDVVQIFRRDWQDTFGVGATVFYFLDEALELNGSLGYDSNAVPDATLDAALMDADKLLLSLGAVWSATEHVALSLTLSEVYFFARDTHGVAGNEALSLPSRQPGNAGEYTQNILLLNTGVEVRL